MTLDFPLAHPTLIINAGILDVAKEFMWPEDNGPLQNVGRLLDVGAWFIPLGWSQLLLLLASLLGLNFEGLGKFLDEALGLKTPADIANVNVDESILNIFGKLAPDQANDLMRSAISGGLISLGADALTSSIYPLTYKTALFGNKKSAPDVDEAKIEIAKTRDKVEQKTDHARQEVSKLDFSNLPPEEVRAESPMERKYREAYQKEMKVAISEQNKLVSAEIANVKTQISANNYHPMDIDEKRAFGKVTALNQEIQDLDSQIAKATANRTDTQKLEARKIKRVSDLRLAENAFNDEVGRRVRTEHPPKLSRRAAALKEKHVESMVARKVGTNTNWVGGLKPGDRIATVMRTTKTKGFKGGLLVAMKAAIKGFLGLVPKLLKGALLPKSLFGLVARGVIGAGIYLFATGSGEQPEKLGTIENKATVHEEVNKVVQEASKTTMPTAAPTFQTQLGMAVNIFMSQ
jgi:hypothetical protein